MILAAVKFNNVLFVDTGIDFLPVRKAVDGRPQRILLQGQPCRHHAKAGFINIAGRELARGSAAAHFDLVSCLHCVARDVNFATVYTNVAMIDKLPGRLTRLRKAEQVDDIVQPGFQQLKETVPGDSTFAAGPIKGSEKLFLSQAISEPKLLLLI